MISNNTHIHFVGISGIGMSGIAKILRTQGYHISGCDLAADTLHINELKQMGCSIAPHHQHEICNDSSINYIVHTTDIAPHHPELLQAMQRNIKVIHRATMLAEIMRSKFSIGVAGSHGKTTTSSLLVHTLLQLNAHPSFVIGGHLNLMQTNAHFSPEKLLVAETDESDRSFLQLPKSCSIITNIDLEHLETYKNFDDIQQTFVTYMNQLPFYGFNVICLDDAGIRSTLSQLMHPFISYGQHSDADIQISNIRLYDEKSIFDIYIKKSSQKICDITIPLMGIHNVLNATAVITMALELGFAITDIVTSLITFQGVDRRFTIKGISKRHNAIIVDDYGHHPEEIRNVILVARKKAKKRLVMLFQPHRHTRTHHLWNDFIKVLSSPDLDQLIITDIFAKGETPFDGYDSKTLVQKIKQHNPNSNVVYLPLHDKGEEIISFLHQNLQKDDLLMLQGAGKINKFADDLLDS